MHHGTLEAVARGVGVKCIEVTDSDADGRRHAKGGSELPDRFSDVAVAQVETARRDGDWLAPGGSGGRRALMIYTSGTTGRPKGAVHTHAGLTAQLESLTRAWE